MLPYQQRYIDNVRQIASLSDLYAITAPDFDSWYALLQQNGAALDALKAENTALLGAHLFPLLDALHAASAEDIAALEEFAAALMDWSTNLDCGIYLLIHESLLSLARFRRDRASIIKELYMVGMGLYYQGRRLLGTKCAEIDAFYFRNEMIFTEAGSYLQFFHEIDDEQTKGYIIRALANIAICTQDLRRRVGISQRVLQIVQDPYYRSMAPSLPWDVFLRRTHQQMSSNRAMLSRGGLSAEELSAVLESCQVVFQPESDNDTPNVRWLWPYYEMEYSCGFVDLSTTLHRMQRLIDMHPYDQYDMSGLYANVQLPIYYGSLVRRNPTLAHRSEHIRFLAGAYEKMMRVMMSCPSASFTDFFFYLVSLVVTDYYETDGVMSYREVTTALMRRLSGALYIRSQRVGEIMRCLSRAIVRDESGFFDDIDFLRALTDPAEKERAVTEYAYECGLYHDFGLIKMNFDRLCHSRALLESEQKLYELHTLSGHDDLASRASTARYADIALGHHAWYNGAGGYGTRYVRNESPYRQMTDLAAIATVLSEDSPLSAEERIDVVLAQEGRRFSPLLTSYLTEDSLKRQIAAILSRGDEASCRAVYKDLWGNQSDGKKEVKHG